MISNLFAVVCGIVLLAIDICALFVVIRLAVLRWQIPALKAIDDVGNPLISQLNQWVQRWQRRNGRNRPLTEQQQLAVGLVVLILARLLAAALQSAVV